MKNRNLTRNLARNPVGLDLITSKITSRIMNRKKEKMKTGFWEYTTPGGSGPVAWYSEKEWEMLLDDMAEAQMDSIVLLIKWSSTGYKSSLPFLDQDESASVIASDNRLLYRIIEMAKERNMEVWLAVVCSHFTVNEFGILPPDGRTKPTFHYDPDHPGVQEKINALFEEIATLFGKQVDGIIVEMESVEFDWPHRIPIYNQWAQENDKPCYEKLKLQYMDARAYQKHTWREFLTSRRCKSLKQIETNVRDAGFTGKLSMICETCNEYGSFNHAVNLKQYAETMQDWEAVSYNYWKHQNRLSGIDFCIEQPKEEGLKTHYLCRGVMSYANTLTIPLREHWKLDIEDAFKYQPDTLWFFGADADESERNKGDICYLPELKKMDSFSDGIEARKELLSILKKYRTEFSK